MRITFDDGAQSYAIDGVRVPRVTRVLETIFREFDGVPPDVLVRRRDLGLAVHACCDYFDRGRLRESSVHPEVRPYVEAWATFRSTTGFTPTKTETVVGSRRYRYAGRLDALGYFPERPGELVLIDRKVVRRVSPATRLQTAAYAMAVAEVFGVEVRRRFAVQLLETGRPKVAPEYTDLRGDGAVFTGALTAYRWGVEHGVLADG